MSDSAASSEDQCSCRPAASGQIVPFQRPASVEYDGEANRMVAQLSEVALTAAVISKKPPSPEVRREAVKLLDKVADRLEVVDEHIGVLEVHADLILECMNEDENAYFINDSKTAPLTVTSLIKKRCRTLRVQKMVVAKSGQKASLIQDNENQRLTDCDGALACRIDEAMVSRKVSEA